MTKAHKNPTPLVYGGPVHSQHQRRHDRCVLRRVSAFRGRVRYGGIVSASPIAPTAALAVASEDGEIYVLTAGKKN